MAIDPTDISDVPASGMLAEPVAARVKFYGEYASGVFGWSEWMLTQVPSMWTGPIARPDRLNVEPLYTADSLTQSLAAKDKEIAELRAREYRISRALSELVGRHGNFCAYSGQPNEAYRALVTGAQDLWDEARVALGNDIDASKRIVTITDRAESAEAQLTALRSLVAEAASALTPLSGYAISSIGSDLDGWIIKLADNAQQPTFNDFERVRRTLTRLNEAVKP